MPPKQVASIRVRDQPGWITFSLDGRYAYPSTGDIIDTKTRQIVGGLTDERGRAVQSEKMVERSTPAIAWSAPAISSASDGSADRCTRERAGRRD